MPHRVIAYMSRMYSALCPGCNGIDIFYVVPEMNYIALTYGPPKVVAKLPDGDDLFTYDKEG